MMGCPPDTIARLQEIEKRLAHLEGDLERAKNVGKEILKQILERDKKIKER